MQKDSPFRTIVLAVVLALSTGGLTAAEKSPDQRYLDGLIARRLFVLAESYCQRQLRRDEIEPRQRTERVIDLSRVYAEQALNAPPEQRAEHWRQAHEVLEQARLAVVDPSLRLLLRRQDALVHLARGRQLRQEAAVVADPQPLLDEAKSSLRQAVFGLDELAADVEKVLIERNRGGPLAADALDAAELQALARDVKYQQAETLRNQALTYPEGDRDRLNALTRAVEQFRPLAERPGAPDWESQLGWIRSLRAAEHYDEAAALLAAVTKRFDEEAVAASIVAQFRLESARLAIARGEMEQALAILDPGPPSGAEQTAAWDYELLVALLRQWQQAEGTSQAAEWQTKATEQVRLIEARHSPYWRRRAESLLGSIVAASPATDDLEVLVRAAQSYYRSGNIDDASAAYQRAYQQAVKAQLVDRAFDIGYTLASIEHERRRHAAASERFRELALAHSGHERAPQAHLMAIFHAAQTLRDQPTSDADRYEALLAEHLGRWPRSDSTDQARIWLGRLHQQRREWKAAAEAFAGVRAASTHAAEAVDRAAACYRAWLAESTRADERTRIANLAADYFESVVFGATQSWPEEFSPPQRAAALHAGRFRLQYAGGDYGRVEKLLAVALDRAGDAEPKWRSTARVWLVLAVAMQPNRLADAAALLEELSGVDPEEWLGLSRALHEASAEAPPDAAVELARLQLQVVDRLGDHSNKLSPAQATQVALVRAAALARVDDSDLARAAYAKLADDLPNDGHVQATYAELLLAGEKPSDWQQALLKWREIERRSPPASTRWYTAKLAQATAYEKLGNCRQALRIIALTRVLHNDLGGPAMKKKFDAIVERCGQ